MPRGVFSASPGDAVANAKTPVMDQLAKEHQYCTLAAHGLSVGLPEGLMGNSEVGHLNIGAGRVMYQDIVRIKLALADKSFGKNDNLQKVCVGNGVYRDR
jgi:2,3-bisphosphoglycerate-independent phosphoglycerate mutase